jgi:hypothetical protein
MKDVHSPKPTPTTIDKTETVKKEANTFGMSPLDRLGASGS